MRGFRAKFLWRNENRVAAARSKGRQKFFCSGVVRACDPRRCPRCSRAGSASDPLGLHCRSTDEPAKLALAELSRRALIAKVRFITDGPEWAQPLPTSWNVICALRGVGGRMELLGNYAASLLGCKWDYDTHGSFHGFCCGMMAERSVPSRLRNDPELRKEFPPKKLEGLMPAEMAMALDLSEMRLADKARLRESGS